MDVRREESKNEYFTKYQHRVSYYSHWITNPKLNSDLEFITNTFDNLPQENTLYIYLFVRSMIKMLYVSIKKKHKFWPFYQTKNRTIQITFKDRTKF